MTSVEEGRHNSKSHGKLQPGNNLWSIDTHGGVGLYDGIKTQLSGVRTMEKIFDPSPCLTRSLFEKQLFLATLKVNIKNFCKLKQNVIYHNDLPPPECLN